MNVPILYNWFQLYIYIYIQILLEILLASPEFILQDWTSTSQRLAINIHQQGWLKKPAAQRKMSFSIIPKWLPIIFYLFFSMSTPVVWDVFLSHPQVHPTKIATRRTASGTPQKFHDGLVIRSDERWASGHLSLENEKQMRNWIRGWPLAR